MTPAGLGMPWDPPRRAAGSVRGKGSLDVPAQTAAPATQSDKRMKMDGWMDNKFMTFFLSKVFFYSLFLFFFNESVVLCLENTTLHHAVEKQMHVMDACFWPLPLTTTHNDHPCVELTQENY